MIIYEMMNPNNIVGTFAYAVEKFKLINLQLRWSEA